MWGCSRKIVSKCDYKPQLCTIWKSKYCIGSFTTRCKILKFLNPCSTTYKIRKKLKSHFHLTRIFNLKVHKNFLMSWVLLYTPPSNQQSLNQLSSESKRNTKDINLFPSHKRQTDWKSDLLMLKTSSQERWI